MNFLLDTNLVSEWAKPRPNPGVVAWTAKVDEDRVFISVVTLAELMLGVERLPVGARRKRLETWLNDELTERFEGRVLPIDAETAQVWGRLTARAQAAGRPLGSMDGFIAATAERHDLALVTRNVSDFAGAGVRLIDPWNQE